ncbi:MAG: STAS domain-containing protein [Methyloprofundus sp.]|nr:STAS domain-containing protein [Methyloprofundus sp.]
MTKTAVAIELIELATDNYQLKGDLTFATVNKKSTQLINFQSVDSTDVISLDLQYLGKIDSAGLALLIEWIKFSRKYHKQLRFDNIPAQLSALAKLSYLSEFDLLTTHNNN